MQDLIGTTFGHYRIVEHLGGGGMGVVYRAEDTKLGREVALKFLPPEWSRDPAARERFLREARAASALEDSRICTVHDIDETDDGQLFIAMAFYEGETLKKQLERGRLPIGTAVDIAIQVAEGLELAHAADIVHRDIKPANLMLTQRDEVVIVDFGLAKLAGELSLTKSGSSLGTPHYMSPEQARGDRVDGRTDLWSLGVVLFEMLAGRRPFGGENNTAVARAILDDEPTALSDLRPEVPPELSVIVAKALEKDADKRYQSAGEFLAHLKGLQDQLSEREGPTEAAPSRVPSRRLHLAPVLVAAALFATTVAVVWFLRSDGVKEPADTALPRIVVLPFENLGLAEDAYFAAGMTEEITSRLGRVSGLGVISRNSAIRYAGTEKTMRQIGEELGVGFVLEGTVRWARQAEGSGRVRITPQLIRVADDTHLWADSYERLLDDIFAVQSEIAEAVVGQLGVALLPGEQRAIAARPTQSMEAHQAYLRGLEYYWDPDDTKESYELAVRMFERAVGHDPAFVAAHSLLSEAHSALYLLAYDRSPERLEAAREAALRALELDPDSPEGHRALGSYHSWGHRDYQQALEEYSLAARRLPNDSLIVAGIGWVRRRQGRFDEAIAGLEKALELDPRNAYSAKDLALTYQFIRHYPEADRYYDLSISLAPDQVEAYRLKARNHIVWKGSLGLARVTLERTPRVDVPAYFGMWVWLERYERDYQAALDRLAAAPDGVFAGWLWSEWKPMVEGDLYSLLNQPERARASYEAARVLLEKRAKETPQDHETRDFLGYVYAGLGRKADAIREARKAVELLPVSKDAFDGVGAVWTLAAVYTMVGEQDAAIDQLEYLLSIPSWLSAWDLRLDPHWDPLRDHPRFQALLEKYDVN